MKYDYKANAAQITSYMNKTYFFEGKTILDIGCGNGGMVREIADKYNPKHITGVDLKLRVDEEKSRDYTLIDGIDSCKLPFDDNSFDFIYSISTFEHIADVSGTLAEVRRVLKSVMSAY